MLYAFMAFACVLHAPFTQNAQPISFRFNYLVITSITIQWTNHKADRTGNSPNLIYFQASRTLLLTIKLPEVLKQHGTWQNDWRICISVTGVERWHRELNKMSQNKSVFLIASRDLHCICHSSVMKSLFK
jgi:hypothetical protein